MQVTTILLEMHLTLKMSKLQSLKYFWDRTQWLNIVLSLMTWAGQTFWPPGCDLPFHHLVVAHSDVMPGANASARVWTHTGFSLSWNRFSGEAMNYFAIVITNYHGWVIWMAVIYFHAVLKVRRLRLKYLQGWFLREFLSWKTANWLTYPWASGFLCL